MEDKIIELTTQHLGLSFFIGVVVVCLLISHSPIAVTQIGLEMMKRINGFDMFNANWERIPGRYVGVPDEEDDFNFEERFNLLSSLKRKSGSMR